MAEIKLMREALKAQRVDVETVVIIDGAEVIRYFRALDLNSRSRVPDMVLLDMHLPKYDGEEILNALRSSERIAQTPVVFITGSTVSELKKSFKCMLPCTTSKSAQAGRGMRSWAMSCEIFLGSEKARREADQGGTNRSPAEGAA